MSRYECKGLETAGHITVLDPNGKLVVEVETPAPEITGICYNQLIT